MPEILLMSDYPPDEQHGGGVLLRRLCAGLPKGSVAWFSSRPLHAGRMPEGLEAIPFACADFSWRRPSRLGIHRWREYLNFRLRSSLQAAAAADWAKGLGVRGVWAVMQEQMIVSGPATARKLGLPFHVSVHDVPSYLLSGRLPASGMRWVEAELLRNFREAASRDVIWEEMRQMYREKTGCDASIVMHGWDDVEELARISVRPPAQDKLRLHGSGMIYDAVQLRSFIEALRGLVRSGQFPPFTMTLSGSDSFKPALHPWPEEVEWLGWLPDSDLFPTLSRADLLYLQHPFDEARRDFAATSFPAKLPSYLRARRPILFHAPAHSTTVQFARRYGLPLALTEPTPDAAARHLASALSNGEFAEDKLRGYDAALAPLDWRRTMADFRKTMKNLVRAE
ncbi:MAG: hypothetical protein JO317_03250 [Verrucomicrobiae bacterium]|nr:hypothetical protein [Verrucomicrobiae bacterium]